ncbi:transcription elongation factor A protein 3 isoform X1 [Ornithorhynchus anatinus]|nr:transcription elongation factor A protein 3 isoform X1 [Ornithorhynchus anatinus]
MGRQEELLRIAKKLEKMVSGDSAEGALELLKELSSCTMTIQLLQTTRIGVAVNAVRKRCPDQQVVALAKVLIKNWKRLLDSSGTPHRDKEASGEKEKKAKGHAAPSGHRPGAAATAPAGDDRGRSGVTPRHRRESAGSTSPSTPPCSAPSSRRPPGDRDNGGKAKVEIPQSPSPPTSPTSPMPSPSLGSAGCLLAPCYLTGDSVRDKCVEMLAAVLKVDGDYKEFGVNCEQLASEIEDHIYQELKSTDMKYRNRVRSRISNLRDPRNPALRRSVLCGGIAASRIARMTAEEMASDELKELRNAMTLEAIREHQMAKTGGTTTDLFQCSKCKKKNCTYNQVQTRSADEPMTTFVLCNECGNRWKFC